MSNVSFPKISDAQKAQVDRAREELAQDGTVVKCLSEPFYVWGIQSGEHDEMFHVVAPQPDGEGYLVLDGEHDGRVRPPLDGEWKPKIKQARMYDGNGAMVSSKHVFSDSYQGKTDRFKQTFDQYMRMYLGGEQQPDSMVHLARVPMPDTVKAHWENRTQRAGYGAPLPVDGNGQDWVATHVKDAGRKWIYSLDDDGGMTASHLIDRETISDVEFINAKGEVSAHDVYSRLANGMMRVMHDGYEGERMSLERYKDELCKPFALAQICDRLVGRSGSQNAVG